MKTQLKKAFFGHIKDIREDLESQAMPGQKIFRNVEDPGVLYDWMLSVGGFLLENDVITTNDLSRARSLVMDYAKLFS